MPAHAVALIVGCDICAYWVAQPHGIPDPKSASKHALQELDSARASSPGNEHRAQAFPDRTMGVV